jgi:DNA-binding transcriptional LysR family regulator
MGAKPRRAKQEILLHDKERLSHTLSIVARDSEFDLRQVRTFVAVARHRSFTRAAEELFIAQQAVSQHIRSLERTLGVTLLRRSPRHVELTAEGAVFLADCRRIMAAVNRANRRVQAAARGEAGRLRLGYTLTTAWDTTPRLLARLSERYPQLRVDAREVFGGDIADLLLAEQLDVALAPMTAYPRGLRRRTVRREPLRIALSAKDPLAGKASIDLAALRDRRFEVWPREMAPGFYDAVLAACRAAGFEPELDERATGNTVWGYLARGRGVALINDSLREQQPRGVTLADVAGADHTLSIEAIWHAAAPTTVQRVVDAAIELAAEGAWL